MKGRANYKKFSSSDTGYITVTFKTALYDHSSSTCGGLEHTTYIGPWVATSKNCTPSTGWGYCTTNPDHSRDVWLVGVDGWFGLWCGVGWLIGVCRGSGGAGGLVRGA